MGFKINSGETPENVHTRNKLKCIKLPLCVIFLFIFYWFVGTPLVFIGLYKKYQENFYENWPPIWPVYFWTVVLLVFVLILILSILLWRKKMYFTRRNNNPELYTITLNNLKTSSDLESSFNKEDSVVDKVFIKLNISEENADEVNSFCDVNKFNKHLSPPLKIINGEGGTSQNLSVPLSPRELFFHDMIENVNKASSSATSVFIEHEKLYTDNLSMRDCFNDDSDFEDVDLNDSPTNNSDDFTESVLNDVTNNSSSEAEFFIANIPERVRCTEVFMFVGEEENKFNMIELDKIRVN